MTMSGWIIFWAAWLVIAGAAFVVITCIVAVKGFGDLRAMFAALGNKRENIHDQDCE